MALSKAEKRELRKAKKVKGGYAGGDAIQAALAEEHGSDFDVRGILGSVANSVRKGEGFNSRRFSQRNGDAGRTWDILEKLVGLGIINHRGGGHYEPVIEDYEMVELMRFCAEQSNGSRLTPELVASGLKMDRDTAELYLGELATKQGPLNGRDGAYVQKSGYW